ncbi:MAG TPA: protein kinase, partial [Nannocystis sp.]
ATVWHARDERTGREVALKVLHGQFAEDKSRRDRFFRGAWKMSELKHPAIVQVFEPYGEEGGRYYFVMEYMSGGTLHEAVLDKKMEADAVIAGIVAVGQALAHAHAHGLVHRDIKPSNVLLGSNGQAKLTDFDLVRAHDAPQETRTGPMGSFIYSAPEVLNRPQDADHRADVYGLAMTAVFGLYGAELPLDVVRDADRFIDRLRCGGLVKDVLKKGVAWELERRFASAAEFTQALATAWAEKEAEAAAADEQARMTAWAAMFVGGEAGATAAGAVARSGAPEGARGREAGATAAGARPLEGVERAATEAHAEPATEVSRLPSGVGEARAGAVVMQPAPEKPRRGAFAALGLLATAALVLLALQIGKSVDEFGPGDPALEIHGASEQPQSTAVKKKDDAPTGPPSPAPHTTSDREPEGDAQAGEPTKTSQALEDAGTSGGPDDGGEAETTGGPVPEAKSPTETENSSADPRASGENKGSKEPKKPSLAERIDDGCIEVKVGNAEAGVRTLSAAFNDAPRNVKLLGCLAQGMDQIANYTQAEHFYQLLLQQSGPRNKVALLGLAQV